MSICEGCKYARVTSASPGVANGWYVDICARRPWYKWLKPYRVAIAVRDSWTECKYRKPKK